MSKTTPVNDVVLVELNNKKYGDFASSEPEKNFEIGTLVAVSPRIFFLSSFSYVLEDSFKYPEVLEELRLHWQERIGQQVRWEARADQGTSFEEDGKQFACVKITKLIGEVA